MLESQSIDLDDPGNWPEHITDRMRQILVRRGPVQVSKREFPVNSEGRRFTTSNYKRRLHNGEEVARSWLIYSVTKDAIFCFCCRLFGGTTMSLSSREGFSDWKHMSGLLSDHDRSLTHMKAFQSWFELANRLQSGKTVDAENQAIIRNETERWKEVLKRLLCIIQFLASQNLAFRGQNDTIYSRNNGNFLKLVECIAQFDVTMAEHLRRITCKETHVHYLSKDIQNEIIELLGSKIKDKILTDLMKATYYSIILDCTPDVSHTEQMTLIVRFVKVELGKEPSIEEHFLGFLCINDSSGEGLTTTILEELEKLKIPLSNMRGQGYDNGANMKGKHSGVQKRILDLNSRAFFVPCSSHSLNLVVNDSAMCCSEAVNFFALLQEVYNYFSSSTYRWSVLQKHISNFTLKPLSDTRWESCIDAVKSFRYQLGEIYDALFEASKDSKIDVMGKNKACSLARKLLNFKFVCVVVFWYEVLSCVNVVSHFFQQESVDIQQAVDLLKKTKCRLQNMRSDEGFQNILVDAKVIAEELDIQPQFENEPKLRPRKVNRQFLYESEDEPINDPYSAFKCNFYFCTLDTIICSLNERFQQLKQHSEIFGFLYDIHPITDKEYLLKCCKDLQLSLTDKDHCDIDGFQLYQELLLLPSFIRSESGSKPLQVLTYICKNSLIGLFPNATIALRILLTIPVSVASAERSFSKLKLIKNYLRSTMTQERLVGLSMMSIECDVLCELDTDTLIKDFAEKKARKVNFT